VGVTSRTVWVDGTTARGYHASDFEDAFARYVPGETQAPSTNNQAPEKNQSPMVKDPKQLGHNK
jgi:hypothetical protein